MAEHNIFWGGQRTRNLDWGMLPSTEPAPTDYIQPDHRSASCQFSPTFTLDPNRPRGATYISDGMSPAQARFFEALGDGGTPLAVGDVLNIMILPIHTRLNTVTVQVYKPVAGLTFDLAVRGNGIGGALPFALGVSAATEMTEMYDLYSAHGGAPVFFKENDMLQMTITALPADGLKGLGLHVAGEIYEPLMDRNQM